MTNHLTKTSGPVSIPQGDQVVGDPDKGPVCLDSVPGAHKDLAESEMLLDVLVEGFDPDPLEVKRDHLRFGHFEVVGNKEPNAVFGSGNKQKDGSDLGQMDRELGHAKAFFPGSTDCFRFPRFLGQVTEGSFLSVDLHKTVSLDRGQKCPLGLNNKIENRSAGIPGIHQDRGFDRQGLDRLGKDFYSQLDFALEDPIGAGFLGTIPPDRPKETLGPDLENTRHGAKTPDEAIGAMMDTRSLDFLSLPRAGSIVYDQERILPGACCGHLPLVFALKFPDFLWRSFQELMKTIGIFAPELRGNLADRSEFYKPDQTDQINQQIRPLRPGNGSQEMRETGRNFSGNIGSHGFRVLLGCDSIGDFDRKPFYLRSSTASLYLKLLASLIT